MIFSPPAENPDGVFQASLPAATCSACRSLIKRREARVTLRASWRNLNDTICSDCWMVILSWAEGFALRQMEMGLSEP